VRLVRFYLGVYNCYYYLMALLVYRLANFVVFNCKLLACRYAAPCSKLPLKNAELLSGDWDFSFAV